MAVSSRLHKAFSHDGLWQAECKIGHKCDAVQSKSQFMITNVNKAGVSVYAKMSLKTECVLIKNMTPAIFISGTKTGILLFIYDCLKTISISPTGATGAEVEISDTKPSYRHHINKLIIAWSSSTRGLRNERGWGKTDHCDHFGRILRWNPDLL